MRTKGSKNTVNVTAAQLAKMAERNPNALVAVSVGWFKTYNESAAMFGAAPLVAEGEEVDAPLVEREPSGGSATNVQIG